MSRDETQTRASDAVTSLAAWQNAPLAQKDALREAALSQAGLTLDTATVSASVQPGGRYGSGVLVLVVRPRAVRYQFHISADGSKRWVEGDELPEQWP